MKAGQGRKVKEGAQVKQCKEGRKEGEGRKEREKKKEGRMDLGNGADDVDDKGQLVDEILAYPR
jgi:hypothetical protein